jgi:hypothetical protein
MNHLKYTLRYENKISPPPFFGKRGLWGDRRKKFSMAPHFSMTEIIFTINHSFLPSYLNAVIFIGNFELTFIIRQL